MRRPASRLLAGFLAIPLALVGVVLTPNAALAASYMYKNVSTGFCLDSNAAKAVYTNACGAGNNYQHWTVAVYSNTVELKNVSTGFCLDSNAARAVYTNPCGKGRNSYQRWTVLKDGNGFMFKNFATGFCLDSNADRAVYTNSCGADNNYQHWV
jgi:hypothetical protein